MLRFEEEGHWSCVCDYTYSEVLFQHFDDQRHCRRHSLPPLDKSGNVNRDEVSWMQEIRV